MVLWNDQIVFKNHRDQDLMASLKNLFTNNCFSVAENNEHYINYSNEDTVTINQWLCTLEEKTQALSIRPTLQNKTKLFFPPKSRWTEEAKQGWCFIDNPSGGTRIKNRLERLFDYKEDCDIYGLALIYSQFDEEKVLIINNSHNPIPMKLWVNGDLVFSSHKENLVRRAEGIVKLLKGCNIILVERSIIHENKIKDMFMDTYFTVVLRRTDFFKQREKKLTYIDDEILNNLNKSVRFICHKKIFNEGEKIPFYLLGWGAKVDGEEYEVIAWDYAGRIQSTTRTQIYKQCDLILKKGHSGIIKIVVLQKENLVALEYILVGTWEASFAILQTDDQRIRVNELLEIIDFKKNTVRNSIYPIDTNVTFHVFQNLYELFSNYEDSLRQYYTCYRLEMIKTRDQGRKRNYGVYLPKGFEKEKKYPLVLQYISCYGDYAIPGLNGNYPKEAITYGYYNNVIVALIPHTYDKFNMYEELVFHDIYEYLLRNYPIDIHRVSLLGYCGSAGPCMQILKNSPQLFASAAFLSPYIEEVIWIGPLMDILKEIPIYFILNPLKALFLPGLKYIEAIPEATVIISPGIEHEEIYTYYLSHKLMETLCSHKKEEVPQNRFIESYSGNLGIRAIYTKGCQICVGKNKERTDAKEEELLEDLFVLMQVSGGRTPLVRVKEYGELSETPHTIYVLSFYSLPMEMQNRIAYETDMVVHKKELRVLQRRYVGDIFLTAISTNQKELYVVYNSKTALRSLVSFWKDFLVNPIFQANRLLWVDGEIINLELGRNGHET